MKKTWSVPELIVLAKGGAGEAVLVACKGYLHPTGPNIQVHECVNQWTEATGCAGGCSSWAGS